jgi:hypothetical protein
MPPQSFDDRILELCQQAVIAKDDEAIQPILDELRLLLHEHAAEVRLIAILSLTGLQKKDAA